MSHPWQLRSRYLNMYTLYIHTHTGRKFVSRPYSMAVRQKIIILSLVRQRTRTAGVCLHYWVKMPTTRYTHAVVCRIPRSLKDRLPTLDYDRAKRQHENYVRALRDIGLDVIEMPADEETPWCAFVDDTAFVCNGTAIITKPAEPERAKEVS